MRSGIALQASDNIVFQGISLTRDKEGCVIRIEVSKYWDTLLFLNLYVPNNFISKYYKQK